MNPEGYGEASGAPFSVILSEAKDLVSTADSLRAQAGSFASLRMTG